MVLCTDVGSAVKKHPPRQYAAPRRDYPNERVGSDANASYRRPIQSKLRIQRPRARGHDGGCQKEEVMELSVNVTALKWSWVRFLIRSLSSYLGQLNLLSFRDR